MKETPAACSRSAPLTSIVSLLYSISVHYYKYNIIIIIMIIIYKQDLFCSSGILFRFWPLEMEKKHNNKVLRWEIQLPDPLTRPKAVSY